MRVGVLGAGGRMGREVCRAVADAPDLELVAAVDPGSPGRPETVETDRGPVALPWLESLEDLATAGVEVVVDFTVAEAARANLARVAALGIHAVVGTSGLQDEDLDALAGAFSGPAGGGPNAVVAANFAIGAVLMMRFAREAAPFFDGAEVIELHHDRKIDAPSGTAAATVAGMIEARHARGGAFGADPTTALNLAGVRGGDAGGGIRVHSIRLPGLVAHQEVIFGGLAETLTIRHDTIDRRSFMPGVLLAVRRVAELPGLTVGLDAVLGI